MFPVECACEVKQHESYELLQQHFNLFYKLLSGNPPDENLTKVNGIYHCLSGLPNHNVVVGCPEQDWESGINHEIDQFSRAHLPFIWYVDEEANPAFKEKLKAHGFQDAGLFQGVMGAIGETIPQPKPPLGCTLELVADEKTMTAFNELICATIGMQDTAKESYKKALWQAAHEPQPLLFHWVAKKEGKVVSALTTLVHGGAVSFWNGATLPEYRCHGINTALRSIALKDAYNKGCRTGISYLMGDGMAFGICKKLGFETKWRFHAFQSPQDKS